ncbi:MAG: HupE/UreJ family protein [Saprospiraceae bacterium]|nr:HupE/UreJ family protein [Saprospiraceae bacterium]
MEGFSWWFQIGVQHILDTGGIDHMVYLIALVIPFGPGQWKRLLLLVTAFTLGHSITLALSTTGWLRLPSSAVELAIALTIAFSCIMNLLRPDSRQSSLRWRYAAAALFGCIHGMGFSILLRSLLGSEGDILLPLFAFNTGLEAGQLVFVCLTLAAKQSLLVLTPVSEPKLTTTTSFVILGLSLYFIAQRTWLFFNH